MMIGNVDIQTFALIIILVAWTFAWKGVALWRAAKLGQKNWFIALIILSILNLLGLVEIIYLFFFAKKKLTIKEVKSWFVKQTS